MSSFSSAALRRERHVDRADGSVVGLETVLDEFSYGIALYGEPHLRAPWGRQVGRHIHDERAVASDGAAQACVQPVSSSRWAGHPTDVSGRYT